MEKHTPGPWFLIETDGADFTAIATKPAISGPMDLSVEVLGSSEWLRVKPSDLQLMTTAPELLEALLLARDHIDMAALEVSHRKDAERIMGAIAKAYGELFNTTMTAAPRAVD